MESIPTPVKIAAATAGAAYLIGQELENRLALFSDLKLARKLVGYKKRALKGFEEKKTTTDFWYETLDSIPKTKHCICFCEDNGVPDRIWTFQDMENYSNRVANFLIANGVEENDTIALFMENRPEFIGTWLGATKAGIRIAMINTYVHLACVFL